MRKLKERDEALAIHVQAAIDAGKDVSETEPAPDRRKKARVYRKSVPFSHEEALQVALDALQAYFVEQPMFVTSAADSLAKAANGVPQHDLPSWAYSPAASAGEPEPLTLEGTNEEKAVEIEMQTETQLSRTREETIPLKRVPDGLIEEQRLHVTHLRELTDFFGLPDEDLNRLAQAIQESYVNAPSLVPWAELEESHREANRAYAEVIVAALRSSGFSFRRIPPGENPAYFEFSRATVEQLAQSKHEHWMSAKRNEGWRYAPERDNERREHPALVAWSKLPAEMQEKSRGVVRKVQKWFAKAGYEIVKR